MSWKYVQRNENGQYKTTEGGGGGGSSTFADLEDVDLSNLQDGQVPKYNSSTQKWENANESGGSGHNYSTTEQVIGTWIDGKPLYEKTVDMGSFSTGYGQFPHGIANINYIISYQFIGKRSDGNGGWFDNNSVGNDILLTVNKTDVYRQSSNISCEKGYLTIQYTKTTD